MQTLMHLTTTHRNTHTSNMSLSLSLTDHIHKFSFLPSVAYTPHLDLSTWAPARIFQWAKQNTERMEQVSFSHKCEVVLQKSPVFPYCFFFPSARQRLCIVMLKSHGCILWLKHLLFNKSSKIFIPVGSCPGFELFLCMYCCFKTISIFIVFLISFYCNCF